MRRPITSWKKPNPKSEARSNILKTSKSGKTRNLVIPEMSFQSGFVGKEPNSHSFDHARFFCHCRNADYGLELSLSSRVSSCHTTGTRPTPAEYGTPTSHFEIKKYAKRAYANNCGTDDLCDFRLQFRKSSNNRNGGDSTQQNGKLISQ